MTEDLFQLRLGLLKQLSGLLLFLDRFVALKVQTTANLGAYLSTFSTAVPTYLYGTLFAGPYRTPAIYGNVQAVFTNTALGAAAAAFTASPACTAGLLPSGA